MALPSLNSKQIRKIEGLIQGWTTKLTWALLVQRAKTDLEIKTTRQTLNTYQSIKTMFQDKKQELRGHPTKELIKFTKHELNMAEQIQRLTAENSALLERVERQHAFIGEITTIAKFNPSVMSIMEDVKRQIQKIVG
jgi:hypothetical protein